jgi:presequence protease
MQINDIIHGFRLLKTTKIKEAASTAYEFRHEKSGARLLFLQNADDNKVFSITFRTPPTDDTGVAHIVEHSTLCGSRKFPLKEPFVELVKGSLNTFLNAMTFPDKTMYPVASRNDKDFQNLMDVYLDAVFYPAMYTTPEILMQEGWHYEIEDPAEPLRYSGVVYNEMKGALSSPEGLLESKTMRALYPDTSYGYESGGDPDAVPSLTQEMFLDFHKKYYHPSNSYIYLYGDMDIEQKLAFLDASYLSQFAAIPVPSMIERQPLFREIRQMTEEYPIGADESTKEKTYLSLSMLAGEATDAELILALTILDHALLKTQAAPLRQALIDANIGKDIFSNFEPSVLQPFFSIVAANSEADRMEKFCGVVKETLQGYVKNGLDRTLLEASINIIEFKLREADFGQYPKGLMYGINIMNSWLYDGEPTTFLYYEEMIQRMKDGLDNGYFERVLQEHILQNTHKIELILEPSTTLAAKREAEIDARLAEKKAAMTENGIRDIIGMTARLKERQQSEETPEALAAIPLLQLSDIKEQAEALPLEERSLMDTKVLFSDAPTNGIAYFEFYFDAAVVPQELLPYGYLLAEVIGAVDTAKHSYAELTNLINLNTGGISYALLAYSENGQPHSCIPKFKVKARALVQKLPQLAALLQEILLTSSFDDKKRLKELIQQTRVSLEMDFLNNSHQAMSSRLVSYMSEAGAYNEQGEIPFYAFIKELSEQFEQHYEEIKRAFAQLVPMLFNHNGLLVSVTADAPSYGDFEQNFRPFVKALGAEKYAPAVYHWELSKANEGFSSASRVQYVGKGANFLALGHHFTGSMHVLETILRYDYFWTRIRVQGGAYGAFTQFNRSGVMLFGSYRDPNLKETLDVFDGTAAYLRQFDVSEREMDKYVIGTMSGVDMPLTPQMKGSRAAACWLRKITQQDRQQTRNEILATRQQDIRALAEVVDACMQQDILCVFGGEEKLKQNAELFAKLVSIMD